MNPEDVTWVARIEKGLAGVHPALPNAWPGYKRNRTPYLRHVWNAIRGRGR